MNDIYLSIILAQSVGASTIDGNGYEIEKLTDDTWRFREPSEDAPGYGEYFINNQEAADVLRDVFPGSFDSPEAS